MSKPKRIFVFVGNPDNDSLSVVLANAYAEGAREAMRSHLAAVKKDLARQGAAAGR